MQNRVPLTEVWSDNLSPWQKVLHENSWTDRLTTSFTETGSDVTNDGEQIFSFAISKVSLLVSEEAGRHFTSMDTLKIRGVQLQATSGNKVTVLRIIGRVEGERKEGASIVWSVTPRSLCFHLDIKGLPGFVILNNQIGYLSRVDTDAWWYDTTNWSIDYTPQKRTTHGSYDRREQKTGLKLRGLCWIMYVCVSASSDFKHLSYYDSTLWLPVGSWCALEGVCIIIKILF